MNTLNSHKTPRECCRDLNCEHGLRNNYFEGKRLTADSFRVEQKYTLERRWLLNRAIHGWGVVYGYAITQATPAKQTGPGRLRIGTGLALDKCGRELLQTEGPIEFSELVVLDEKGLPMDWDAVVTSNLQRYPSQHGYNPEYCWLLSVHYAEQSVGLVKVKDPCECEYDEWDRTCETVRYSLRRIPCRECCPEDECGLKCECATGGCCDEPKDEREEPSGADKYDQAHQADSFGQERQKGFGEEIPRTDYHEKMKDTGTESPPFRKRGGCRCLCDHLTGLPVEGCGPLCEIEEPCGTVKVDLKNGVPLACVNVVLDECDRPMFEDIEECGPRRLVKRNDLLFDLIRGCDLTRIEKIGWARFHRKPWPQHAEPIEFEDFADALATGDDQESEYVTRDFWVEFSRPVRSNTIGPECFVMTIITGERHDGWWESSRVPIVRVETEKAELVSKATIVVDGPWLRETVRGEKSIFEGGVTRVEVEVRGDFIVDCNGQTVDANPHGRSPVPTGNGTPGGTFLSTFLVGPATSSRPKKNYSEDRIKGVS